VINGSAVLVAAADSYLSQSGYATPDPTCSLIRRNPPFGSAEELIGAYERGLEQRRQEQVAPR
jgi:hypothetical protein